MLHIILEELVSSHFVHELNQHRISWPQQRGNSTLNGGLEHLLAHLPAR